jgi:hypothetical protein
MAGSFLTSKAVLPPSGKVPHVSPSVHSARRSSEPLLVGSDSTYGRASSRSSSNRSTSSLVLKEAVALADGSLFFHPKNRRPA